MLQVSWLRSSARCTRSRGSSATIRQLRSIGGISLAEAKRSWNGKLVVSEEVEHALEKKLPVIALESAIITHGMPNPTNLKTAQSLERILRQQDVTPATIAIIYGRIHIGLSDPQLEKLANPSTSSVKVSRRDLAPALSMGKNGGTTVAGTMVIASSVGIKLFVTGGIGGVHRGAERSMDISADLIELGRTPMAVFCAGAKSILDIPRTLEVLETQGVCVATYGDKPDFPAFYSPSSGMKSPWMVSNASTAANLIHTSLNLPQPLSTLLAVPIPSECSEAGDEVHQAVEQAVKESILQGIDKRGKEVTPWLLKRVGELTSGKALHLNIKLIENNARIGAKVARELANIENNQDRSSDDRYSTLTGTTSHASSRPYYNITSTAQPSSSSLLTETITQLPKPQVLVFGSAAIDITSTPSIPLVSKTTTPGSIFVSPGGVGRNIAEASQKLLPEKVVKLVSTIGAESNHGPAPISDGSIDTPDAFGKLLLLEMESSGLRTDGLKVISRSNSSLKGSIDSMKDKPISTAGCTLALDNSGDLVNGVADMNIVEEINSEMVEEAIRSDRPKMVVFDCNLISETISSILTTALSLDIPTFCDPTSTPKLPRLIPSLLNLLPKCPSPINPRPLTHLSPNTLELNLLSSLLSESSTTETERITWEYVNSLNLLSDFRNRLESFTSLESGRNWIRNEGIITQSIQLLPFVNHLWIKAGQRGVVHIHIDSESKPSSSIPSISASGDTWKPATLRYELSNPHSGHLVITHYPSLIIPTEEIISTTGAGDTFVGGIVAGLVKKQGREEEWVKGALEGVGKTMRSRRAVG